MADLCVNPKETVHYYIRNQPALQNTGKVQCTILKFGSLNHLKWIYDKICNYVIYYSMTCLSVAAQQTFLTS